LAATSSNDENDDILREAAAEELEGFKKGV
jgi:hypothetical protein